MGEPVLGRGVCAVRRAKINLLRTAPNPELCQEKEATLIKRPMKVAGVAGLEPVTSAVTGQRSNRLSYTPAKGTEVLGKPVAFVNCQSAKLNGSNSRRQGGGGGEPR